MADNVYTFMHRAILGLIAAILIVLTVTSCESKSMIDKSENNNRFILIEKVGSDCVYEDTRYGTVYFVCKSKDPSYQWGTILFDSDGKPMQADNYVKTGEDESKFVLAEKIGDDSIYYDKTCGVMYICHVEGDGSTYAWGSVILDADGRPILMDGFEPKTETE